MDDWQACLSPACQSALVQARDSVDRRGGSVITAEDFLLALLDAIPDIAPFLKRQGVDLDELVRTIQGEQPIVTEVRGDGDLSSQLIYWISGARETHGVSWLEWPHLLRQLASGAERMQDKAYVAVLELVSHWPAQHEEPPAPVVGVDQDITPLTVTDPAWLELAEEVVVITAANSRALIWLKGDAGSGKTSWLSVLKSMPGFLWVQVDPRRQAEIMASDQPVAPTAEAGPLHWPALMLDNVSPAGLLELIQQPDGVVHELVTGWQGPVLLLSEDNGDSGAPERLAQSLGRAIDSLMMPEMSATQRKAILMAHQPAIEKRWNIQLSSAAVDYASSRNSRMVARPGGMLEWVRRAAARLDLFAGRGPLGALAVAGQQDALRRQSLVALARGDDWAVSEQELARLSIQQAAAEVGWHERQRSGTLRRLLAEDLREELERWVAGKPGPVHYVLHCEQQHGESSGAGSGNLYS